MAAGRGTTTNLLLITAGLTLMVATSACSVGAHNDGAFATPEAAIKTYISALRRGDRPAVEMCFDPASTFYLPGPMPIETYRFVGRTVFDHALVADWNAGGALPVAREGDVRLLVRQVIKGKEEMFSYNLRLTEYGWRIYAHSGWGDE
jgi:hypothetical protein